MKTGALILFCESPKFRKAKSCTEEEAEASFGEKGSECVLCVSLVSEPFWVPTFQAFPHNHEDWGFLFESPYHNPGAGAVSKSPNMARLPVTFQGVAMLSLSGPQSALMALPTGSW